MQRHWSFVVTAPKYLYPIIFFILLLGFVVAILSKDYGQFNRVGNLIIGVGIWMSLRFTLREGINRTKNCLDSQPVIKVPNSRMSTLNAEYFNKIAYSIGDAKLQIHGFIIVIVGSIIGSYGDLILKMIGFFIT